MPRNVQTFSNYQVFLNYPFDEEFSSLENAFHFPVVAAGLVPVCAKDLTTPDLLRLEMLAGAIQNCQYSAHELSRSKGEGPLNFARMNVPIEMGMAMFHATDKVRKHRYAFFVPTPHDYHQFLSDLSGLDALCHNNDPTQLVKRVYEWLRRVVPTADFNSVETIEVIRAYDAFCLKLHELQGTGENGGASHDEASELMYTMCGEKGWWDIRNSRPGLREFPPIRLAWR
jgi:hypothetical protein